jgi:SAM-dependent methyltransferase
VDQELLAQFSHIEDRHWWFVVRRHIVRDAVLANVTRSVSDVLEVGCGAGGFLSQLEAMFPGARVHGVEPSEPQRAEVLACGGTVLDGVFAALPAADASQDLLLALDVLEHCEDDRAALMEAWRVLRPDGLLVLTVPALPGMYSEHDRLNGHFRRYRRRQLMRLVEEAGFRVRRITYLNMFLLPLGWSARRGRELLGLPAELGLEVPRAPVNALLRWVFSIERPWLRHAVLPIGMSLMLVAERPGVAES